jgi:hypothetical protein
MTRAFTAVVLVELFKWMKSELDTNKPCFFPLKLVHFLNFFVSTILYIYFSLLTYFCGDSKQELLVVQAYIYDMSHRIKFYITF